MQDTHSLRLSRHSGGRGPGAGARTDARPQTHLYILSDIFAVFSADKVDSLNSCFRAVSMGTYISQILDAELKCKESNEDLYIHVQIYLNNIYHVTL